VNAIKKLNDEAGVWWRGEEYVERVLKNYFEELFLSSNPINIEATCQVVNGKLSNEHKSWYDWTTQENILRRQSTKCIPLKPPIQMASQLCSIKPIDIVGEDFQNIGLGILNNNGQTHDINKTFLVLIAKGKNPLLSLCNVIMKIVTKVIDNRLKQTLNDVIDIEQSAFVKGMLTIDIALIAMQCFHWLKKKIKGKKGVMALKLDMSKAYERIEQSFVKQTLSLWAPKEDGGADFCIFTVTYQILRNG
jgi:hypothetical protein